MRTARNSGSGARAMCVALVPLVGLVLLLVGGARSQAAGSRSARIVFLSPKRLYFDAGRLHGVEVGTVARISRRGKVVATCAVDHLGDRQSSCPSGVGRVGDLVTLEGLATVERNRVQRALPPIPSAGELVDAQRQLASAQMRLVDFQGSRAIRGLTQGLPMVTATLSHDAYVSFGRGHYQQERIDVALNGISIKRAGFRVFAHLTAVLASVRPPEQRFRAGDFAQFYVWETALTSREVGRPFTLSVGRVWPYHTPGLTLLDGLQVGWRRKDASAEVGAYGGTVPDAITLYPTYDHYVAGAYYSHVVARGKSSALRLLRHEGRLGVRGAPGFGTQLELELALQAAITERIDLGAQARASIGATDWGTPAFEALRVHLGVRPHRTVRLLASVRYLGPRPADFDSFTSGFLSSSTAQVFFVTSHMVHARLDATYSPRDWISLALQGGIDHDSDSGSGRQYLGPELSFPRLLGRRGGVSLGYREEFGWYAGRQAHVQLNAFGLERVRAMARVSYFEDRLGGGLSSPAQRELGFFAMVDGRVARWLSIRGSAISRVGVDGGGIGSGQPTQVGLTARLDLIGSL